MEIMGLFGLILFAALVLWLKDVATKTKCPRCRKAVDVRASMCPYCRMELEPY